MPSSEIAICPSGADQDYAWAVLEYEVDLRDWELTKKEDRCELTGQRWLSPPETNTTGIPHGGCYTRGTGADSVTAADTGFVGTPDELAGLFKGAESVIVMGGAMIRSRC